MSRKLCVFPNDPISAYYEKGEINERYYNPNNFFDQVDIISFSEQDIEESKVQTLVGSAKLKIHSIGKINLKNRTKNVDHIMNLVKSLEPDVIRAYNPLLEGWFAATCSSKLKIPFFVSLHTQYDQKRKIAKKTNLKKYLALKYMEKFIESYVLKNAHHITIVYKIIEPYVLKHGGKFPELLYNGIDVSKFANSIPIDSLPKPLIISVGNLIKVKNHECIIQAMKSLNSHCLIIGKGNLKENLVKLIKNLNLDQRITIKESIPHSEIPKYYKSALVFALAYDPELEGLPKPVIEAMATGLPVVIPYPKEGYSDGLENTAIFSKRDPDSFTKNIKKLLENENLRNEFVQKSQSKSKEFDKKIIEKREAEIYAELISKH